MFSRSRSIPESESWVDFKDKFGREGSQTKLLESFSILQRQDSFCRKPPSRSSSSGSGGGGSSSMMIMTAKKRGLTRSNSTASGCIAPGKPANTAVPNRRGLLGRTKSQGSTMFGKRSLLSKAA